MDRLLPGVVRATPLPGTVWPQVTKGLRPELEAVLPTPPSLRILAALSLSSQAVSDEKHPTPEERDEPVKIDLDRDEALKALLEVKPEPAEKDEAKPQGDPLRSRQTN